MYPQPQPYWYWDPDYNQPHQLQTSSGVVDINDDKDYGSAPTLSETGEFCIGVIAVNSAIICCSHTRRTILVPS